jgi:hypothetical protein
LRESSNLQKQKDIINIISPKKNSLAKKPKNDETPSKNGHKKWKSNNIKQGLVNLSEITNVHQSIRNIFADQKTNAASQIQDLNFDTPDTRTNAPQDRQEVHNSKPKSPEQRKTATPANEWGSLTQGKEFLSRSVKNGSFNN